MNKEIQKLFSLAIVGVGLLSPVSGESAENSDIGKVDNNDTGKNDTVRGIEISRTLSEEEKKIINMRFQSFLEGREGYEDSELINQSYVKVLGYERDLGYIKYNGLSVDVQGVLLGLFDFQDKYFLAVGIKDAKGVRRITPIEWLIDEKIKVFSTVNVNVVSGSKESFERFDNKNDLISMVNGIIGGVISFDLYNVGKGDLSNERYKNYSDQAIDFLVTMAIPRKEINLKYIAGLQSPPKEKLSVEESTFLKSLRTKSEMADIRSCQEFYDTIENNQEIPLMVGLTYRRF